MFYSADEQKQVSGNFNAAGRRHHLGKFGFISPTKSDPVPRELFKLCFWFVISANDEKLVSRPEWRMLMRRSLDGKVFDGIFHREESLPRVEDAQVRIPCPQSIPSCYHKFIVKKAHRSSSATELWEASKLPVASLVPTEHLDAAGAGEQEDRRRLADKGAWVEISVSSVHTGDHRHTLALVSNVAVEAALEGWNKQIRDEDRKHEHTSVCVDVSI